MDHNAMGMDPCDNQNDAIFNITTDKRTHVDARTGLFEAHVPLPSVTGNVGYGPVVDLSLYYSPVVNNHAALGDGWSFAFTTWYEKNSDLTLHTGEAMRVEKGKDLITPAVMITWSDGGNTLTVERKDGRVETLRKPEAGRVWVPARLTTDGYRYLDFTWATVAQTVGKDTHHQVRLTGIRDPDRTLLEVGYGPDETSPAKVTLTFWPGTNETLQFVLDIKDVALQSVTAPEGTKTTFGYLEHPTCGWLLTAVETFEGLKEDVEYADNGLTFKDNPKLSALPAVNTHTVTPRAGGEKVVDSYKYFRSENASRENVGFTASRGYQTEIRNTGRLIAHIYTSEHQMFVDAMIQGIHKRVKFFGSYYNSHSADTSRLIQTLYDGKAREFSIDSITKNGLVLKMDGGAISCFTYQSAANSASREERFRHIYLASEQSGAMRAQEPGDIAESLADGGAISLLRTRSRVGQAKQLAARMFPLLKKSYTYETITGLNRRKLHSFSITKKVEYSTPALLRQEIDYFSGDDFRKGRQRGVRHGNASDEGAFIESTVQQVIFDYTIDKNGVVLTTTTTEAVEDVSRTSLEARSILSGRLIRQVDTDGNETIYTYDTYGRLSSQTECAQSDIYRQTTAYAYPGAGRVEITEPDGQKRAIESDGRDNTVSEQIWCPTAAAWRDMRSVTYDALGRKKSSSQYDYLADGTQLVVSCDFGYDDWGNECSQSFNDGRTTFNQYDPVRRVREEWKDSATENERKRTTYLYDDTVKKIEWLDTDGNTHREESYDFDSAGKIHHISNGAASVFYAYDPAGRTITEEHFSSGKSHTFSYEYPENWLSDQPRKIEVEFDGKTRTLGARTFDAWGRITSTTRAGITEEYSYTGANTVPDSKSTADGKVLTYRYSKELGNRVTKICGADQSQVKSFIYMHGADRMSKASEGEALLVCDHDLHKRVIAARSQVQKGSETTLKRIWTPAGRLLNETDARGKVVTYEYDAMGRRTRTVAGDLVTTHDYDNQGRPLKETIKVEANEIAVSFTYDASGREAQRRFQLANGFDLTLDRRYYPDGRVKFTELSDGNVSKGKRSYGYTPHGRLETCETTGAWRPHNPKGKLIDKQIFSYDGLGNIIRCESRFEGAICRSIYSYDEATASRLDRVEHDHADYKPSAKLEYDANGRVTRDALGKTYSYDWLGRLTQAGSRYYGYDAMDRIATTGTGNETRQIVYDGMQVRGEYGADGSGRQLEPGSAACTVQRVKRSGVERTLFELRDVDGTVLVTYDATAKAMKHHAYSAYGAHTSDEPDSLLGFNGEYRDVENDQYPLGQGYRSYDPTSMRFHAPDDWSPFGRGGPNAYGYGKGDPVNWQDPSGHMAVGSGSVNRGLRAQWGSSLPGPLGLGSEGALIGTIIWSALGVLTAIATGGASLLLTAALVGMAIVASATAIAAVLVSDTNPELAAILGWVSLGFTIAGGVASLAKKVGEFAMKIGRSGMAVARNAYHRVAVAASRFRASGARSVFRSRASAYRPSSAEGFGSLEQIEEVRPPARPAGARVFSSIEEGYPAPFDFELPPPEQRSAFLGLMDKVHDTLNIGDINTVVCTVTGVLGNAGYFESEQDAFINGNINNSTWLPWGSFNLGRYGFR